MTDIRLGIIGCGRLGRIHARLAQRQAGVELVGVVDPLVESRLAAAAENGAKAFSTLDPLLGAIDAAIVATPATMHVAVTESLIRNGVHVLVEKPLAATIVEARFLSDLATQFGVTLQVGHVERFNPAFVAIRNQSLEVDAIYGERLGAYTGRGSDVGAVLDLMIHDIDLALALAGSPVTHVDAIGGAVFGQHEDWALAHLTFESGAIATLRASRVSPVNGRVMNVSGGSGFAWIDFAQFQAKWALKSDVAYSASEGALLDPPTQDHIRRRLFNDFLPIESVTFPDANPIASEQEEFFAAIREGRPVQVRGAEACEALDVAERVVDSIRKREIQRFVDTITPTIPFPGFSAVESLRRAA